MLCRFPLSEILRFAFIASCYELDSLGRVSKLAGQLKLSLRDIGIQSSLSDDCRDHA